MSMAQVLCVLYSRLNAQPCGPEGWRFIDRGLSMVGYRRWVIDGGYLREVLVEFRINPEDLAVQHGRFWSRLRGRCLWQSLRFFPPSPFPPSPFLSGLPFPESPLSRVSSLSLSLKKSRCQAQGSCGCLGPMQMLRSDNPGEVGTLFVG
ncbi:hypothetical protein B0I72DRAFT_138115 [Yarrowia lipolytica]|uniref:Uncharacterized protein n=1 Tax=Yarrowia lipolytica TaxID=4952 RepID=A0A371C7S5_YARLL|nr:hypothetical protein BKA91DRAFT_137242 [Yarrowia lipolytica]KAE8173920.1 hypothetical protein BKA90DRAFT_134876 [Yarrowia lipolytica]RDW26368.1 hypothetical protein B0I71DRAFT_131012 [Yarrowia lipolytica]RDW32426.1 hypothetical protein B0I72DRAFT_138115 [Yarrowia lipolytica]RDW39502.1 hypothetical protein B0I73DRAFT_131907 [Yarrowia lipolytica]